MPSKLAQKAVKVALVFSDPLVDGVSIFYLELFDEQRFHLIGSEDIDAPSRQKVDTNLLF